MNSAGGLLERDDARHAGFGALRQADEALDLVRHADQRVHRLAVAGARKLQRDGEAEIGNERERMRRIDRERRQHREDVTAGNGPRARPSPALVTSGAIDQDDALFGAARRAARASAPAGRSRARSTPPRRCARAARPGVRPSGLLVGDARAHLALEAGDPHHEEFVEVVGRDRQEPQPLEQRMAARCRPLPAPAG